MGPYMILEIEFCVPCLIVAIIATAFAALAKKLSAFRTLASLLFATYFVMLICLNLLPAFFSPGNSLGLDLPAYPIPGTYLLSAFQTYDAVGNAEEYVLIVFRMTLMYVPLGFLAPTVFPRLKHGVKKYLLIIIVPIFIEFVQLAEGLYAGGLYKRISFDDVLLAVLGSILGLALREGLLWIHRTVLTPRINGRLHKEGPAQ